MTTKESIDQLVNALRKQQSYLKEALEAIERRDISPGVVKEYLSIAEKNFRKIKKDLRGVKSNGD